MSIPNIVPSFSPAALDGLAECLRLGWVSTAGPQVTAFEAEFARLHGTELAVAAASGTAAIHLGLLALGVRPGDLVLCPALTFVATVNPVRYCGAAPVLVGIERRTLGMDPATLADVLERRTARRGGELVWKETGQRVAAVVVAHLYGRVADVAAIARHCAAHGVPLLEDAAESLGARRDDRLAGTSADVGCFSFNGNKLVTCGSGGMILATDRSRSARCRHLSTQAKSDPFVGTHDEVGFNYRMNSLCAALGRAELGRLPELLAAKREVAARYRRLLQGTPFHVADAEPGEQPSHWMAVARLGDPRADLVARLQRLEKEGIGVRPLWQPIRAHAPYADAPYFGEGHEDPCLRSMVCLPSSVSLTLEEQQQVVDALVRAFA